jgi:predicted RNase H-like nuclease (RuvC/YqgF family)
MSEYEHDPQVARVLDDIAATKRHRDQLLNEAEEYRRTIAVLETKLQAIEQRNDILEKRSMNAVARLFEATTLSGEIKRSSEALENALRAATKLKDVPDDGAARIAERFKPRPLAQS